MAVTIKYFDLMNGLGALDNGSGPSEATIKYIIQGITKTGIGFATQALTAPGLPEMGESDPDVPNLVCAQRRIEPHEGHPGEAVIEFRYISRGRPEAVDLGIPLGGADIVSATNPGQYFQIEGSGTLTAYETDVDWKGNPLLVKYDGDEYRISDADVEVAHPVITFSGPMASAYPHVVLHHWKNHINTSPWFGGGTYSWKCTDVTFRLLDTSTALWIWNWSFTFEYAPETWLKGVFYVDADGKIPLDATVGNGRHFYRMNPERDFNEFFRI